MRLVRQFAVAAACMTAIMVAAPAQAQNYPTKPVHIIVPFPAGGSNDIIARLLAQKLSSSLGQQVLVENRGGAGGNIGAESVATSAPDGYTLLLTAPGPLTANAALYENLRFNPVKDFAPVTLIASVPIVLMVHAAVPAKNVQELIALARAKPGTINFGSSGNGSTNHLAGELFKSVTDTKIVHVPYRGAAPAMNDLLAGHIPMMFDNMPAVLPQIAGGRIRAIAVAGAQRAKALPDLPTVAEAGVAGFEASAWFGLVAPAGTPAPVLDRLIREIGQILKSPDVIQRFTELGAEPGTLGGAEFGAFLRDETSKWTKVIQTSGAKVN
jgi:tripartite-type tricarboxylate transporter receptor subunit TctC